MRTSPVSWIELGGKLKWPIEFWIPWRNAHGPNLNQNYTKPCHWNETRSTVPNLEFYEAFRNVGAPNIRTLPRSLLSIFHRLEAWEAMPPHVKGMESTLAFREVTEHRITVENQWGRTSKPLLYMVWCECVLCVRAQPKIEQNALSSM